MSSMYNKSHHKQDGFFPLVGHICIMDKDHWMKFKIHTNHLISSSCLYFITSFSFSIMFYNVNNSSNVFHKYQKYFRFI
jgi:hypothetical protein